MNPQDFTHLKEQYAQMRIDNRPQPMRELLTENITDVGRELIWPQWLFDEEKGIGVFQEGDETHRMIRRSRYFSIWRHVIKDHGYVFNSGYRVEYNGELYWFSPKMNALYRRHGHSTDTEKIQPAIHLLIKAMD